MLKLNVNRQYCRHFIRLLHLIFVGKFDVKSNLKSVEYFFLEQFDLNLIIN